MFDKDGDLSRTATIIGAIILIVLWGLVSTMEFNSIM